MGTWNTSHEMPDNGNYRALQIRRRAPARREVWVAEQDFAQARKSFWELKRKLTAKEQKSRTGTAMAPSVTVQF